MKFPHVSGVGVYSSELAGFKNTEMTPMRTVREYEIELFCENYHYGLIDGDQIPYQKGVILIAKPGNRRCSRPHFTCHYLHILVDDGELAARLSAMPHYLQVREEQEYLELFRRMASLFPKKADDSPLEMTGLFLLLLAKIEQDLHMSAKDGDGLPEPQKDVVHRVRTLINENYHTELSLSSMAESVHLNPNYLHKLFSTATGETPLHYLTEVRLYHAKFYLLNTRHSIGEIAERCGFSSYNYFCTVFRKRVGVAPREFRKRANHYYFASSEGEDQEE